MSSRVEGIKKSAIWESASPGVGVLAAINGGPAVPNAACHSDENPVPAAVVGVFRISFSSTASSLSTSKSADSKSTPPDGPHASKHLTCAAPGAVLKQAGAGGHGPPSQRSDPPNEIFGECKWTSGIKKISDCVGFYVKNCIFIHIIDNIFLVTIPLWRPLASPQRKGARTARVAQKTPKQQTQTAMSRC